MVLLRLLYMPTLIGIIITEYVINQNHARFYMVFLCQFVAKFFPTNYVTISVRFVRGILQMTSLVSSDFLKAEKILKGNLILLSSLSISVKIQIIGGKVCLRCKGKTSPSNVLPYYNK